MGTPRRGSLAVNPYLLTVAAVVAAWFLFSGWVVVERALYDRRLRAVRAGRLSHLSRRALARLAADTSSEPQLAASIGEYLLEHDRERLLASAYSGRGGWDRVEALRILVLAREPLDLAELRRMLDDEDEEIAATAATIVAGIRGDEAASVLLDALRAGGSSSRWIAALLERRRLHPSLLLPLLDDPTPAVRDAAIRLLGGSVEVDDSVLGKLEDLADDPRPDTRAAAARSLGRLGSMRSVRKLRSLLQDRVWFVQIQAARSLGRLGSIESAPEIVGLLSSRTWWVRQAAKDALIDLGPAVTPVLIELLDDPDTFARNSLAEVLQDLGKVESLVQAVTAEPDPARSKESVATLAKILAAGGPGFARSVLEGLQPISRDELLALMELPSGSAPSIESRAA
jgi:HEAT repeat protein